MRLFKWYFIHCVFFFLKYLLSRLEVLLFVTCITVAFLRLLKVAAWITRTFSSLHQPTTQWDDLESKVGNPFSSKQFSRLRKKHFRRWSINHTLCKHSTLVTRIHSIKNVLVSDTKVGKCWFREVTWPFKKPFKKNQQKILSQRFMI